ncbi:hypothetical protein Poly30_36250 [Planctomycetes bacterium Poly30]|uniref:Probable inorganic carbon transporter subunit DabA n=2 Tax=Saltatorellus ferox TaxID=2528018 RepID=A0A518EVG6_9BACT|nr:hypothetical protein Poly30_36250 [Planctomycetes bacterium Poly30]
MRLNESIDAALRRIAPTWPLDRFIAVNPLWGQIDRPLHEVAAELASLTGSKLVMSRAWYRREFEAGRLRTEHLERALHLGAGSSVLGIDLQGLLDWLRGEEALHPRRARVVDVVDGRRDLDHQASWQRFVTTNVSQFCASYFDDGQASLRPDRSGGLYASWHRLAQRDRGPALLMGMPRYQEIAKRLPAQASDVFEAALDDLGVSAENRELYLASLLLDLGGWAAWCTYQRFMAELQGGTDASVVDLLAILVAWEWILHAGGGQEIERNWRAAMRMWNDVDRVAIAAGGEAWLVQSAMELAWQGDVNVGLRTGFRAVRPRDVAVQAAFCIDVRSEVYRRALEAQSDSVQTMGFAGFFGMPAEYVPAGATKARPQLPGLLAPRLRITDVGVNPEMATERRSRLATARGWKGLKTGALSTFVFVEALGVPYAFGLLKDSLQKKRSKTLEEASLSTDATAARKPRLTETVDGKPLAAEERADLAAGILRAMSLTDRFARLVLLAGHGSQSKNNPHAGGLDCGACCGQTGEVNARATAALLNEPEVREDLTARGVVIPPTTHFLAGLHNTTTDQLELFDLDEVPSSHAEDIATLKKWLQGAGAQSRRERAARLGLDPARNDADLLNSVEERTGDWSQVRPEWGLADNAGFIVAPRERTKHMTLNGQCFLHDYRADKDEGFAILELIMTAPMVVTHWINFQYYASTVDNRRYGSGNKALHNVVGAHIGVFEGNGGDLRTGLSMQSLHDGERWVHTPRRLSVFIEAPEHAIDSILERHDHVRALVTGGWVHLIRMEAQSGETFLYERGTWTPCA